MTYHDVKANRRQVLVSVSATGLTAERLEDRLAHPPHRIGDELHTLIGIELPDRLQQPFVPDGDELGEIEAVPLVLLHV